MTITNAISRHTGAITRAISSTTDSALHAGRHATLDTMDGLYSSGRQLRHALLDTRDDTLRYMRHEPARAIMIAAAAGIVVLGVAALLSRPRHRD